MDKFITHCDQIEDEILNMLSNLQIMLKTSESLYQTSPDQSKQEEQVEKRQEREKLVRNSAFLINKQIKTIKSSVMGILKGPKSLSNEVPDQSDKLPGLAEKRQIEKQILQLITEL